MEYELKIIKTDVNGRHEYKVVDETGAVINTRNSTNQYVACTIDGYFYFKDLKSIGKGDHGRNVKYIKNNGGKETPIAYLKTDNK